MRRSLSLGLLVVVALLAALVALPVYGGNHGDSGAVPLQEDGMEKAKRVQDKHTEVLLANPNIVGIGVGLNPAGQPVIRLFTVKPGVGVPERLDGVAVEAVVTGIIVAAAASVAPQQLDAEFTWSCSGLDCSFDASSTSGKGKKTYSWDFDASNDIETDATGKVVFHTYGSDGKYTVTLTASTKGETNNQAYDVTVSDGGGSGTTDCYAGGRNTTTAKCDRPVPIGVSTGHPDITAGTIGARVVDDNGTPDLADDDVFYALSNNHVYANQNDASIGDTVIQPGTFDGGSSPADDIGTLADFPLILFDGRSNLMDAAIALSSTADLGNATPNDGYGTPSSNPAAAWVGQSVQKYGRTTGLTIGQVSEINVTVDICYEGRFVCTKLARFTDQIAITDGSFSAGGDSGSLIVTNDANKNPVGLLFAGSSTRTIANDIGNVLARFGVTVDGLAGDPVTPPPNSSLSVSITIDPASYANRESVQITVTVTDDTSPVGNVAVHVKITTASGNILSADNTTGGDGITKFRYKVNSKRDGVGTYTVDATASKPGYDPGTDTMTFEVTK